MSGTSDVGRTPGMTDHGVSGPASVWVTAWRAAAWAAAGFILTCLGLLGLLAALACLAWLRAGEVSDLQWTVWTTLGRSLLAQALVPQLLLTVLLWLPLRRLLPRLESSWRGVLLGTPLAAGLAFLPVGTLGFAMWEPTSWVDLLNTWLLVAAGCAVALILPRRLLPFLAPRALERSP